MKKLFTLILLTAAITAKSQDTLFIKGTNKVVPCEINKILSGSIFYSDKKSTKTISMSEVTKYSLGKTQFVDGTMIRDFDGKYVNNSTFVRCSGQLNGKRCKENTTNSNGKCSKHQ